MIWFWFIDLLLIFLVNIPLYCITPHFYHGNVRNGPGHNTLYYIANYTCTCKKFGHPVCCACVSVCVCLVSDHMNFLEETEPMSGNVSERHRCHCRVHTRTHTIYNYRKRNHNHWWSVCVLYWLDSLQLSLWVPQTLRDKYNLSDFII